MYCDERRHVLFWEGTAMKMKASALVSATSATLAAGSLFIGLGIAAGTASAAPLPGKTMVRDNSDGALSGACSSGNHLGCGGGTNCGCGCHDHQFDMDWDEICFKIIRGD